jgi:hypothetical protein
MPSQHSTALCKISNGVCATGRYDVKQFATSPSGMNRDTVQIEHAGQCAADGIVSDFHLVNLVAELGNRPREVSEQQLTQLAERCNERTRGSSVAAVAKGPDDRA